MSGGGAADGPRVAFQGELGAFSEEAVRRLLGPRAVPVPRRDFRDVGSAVAAGEVDLGLLPVENSLAGSVVASYDVLAAGGLRVVGEVVIPIHHCVLGLPGASLDGVARIMSHPVALAQCTRFLRARPGVEAVAVYDTAGAARQVAEVGDPSVAAIAGRSAAERYGLGILAADVEDRPDNQTRFFAVARAEVAPAAVVPDAADGPRRTALLVETPNTPGALVRVLNRFAERGINLSKLESRPAAEPWTYRFFMELDADADAPDAAAAIAEAAAEARVLHLLGSFPAATPPPAPAP